MESSGERLAKRLAAMGMSQSALAREVGLTQSAINQMIKRGVARSPHLHKIARALATTPEYLISETDDPAADTQPPATQLTPDEMEIVRKLRRLSPADRESIFRLATSLARSTN